VKKISIHIGLPKTATTYIQKTLSSQNSYLGLESKGGGVLNIFFLFL